MVALNVPYIGLNVAGVLPNWESMLGRQVDGVMARTDPTAANYTSVDWFLTTAVGGNGRPVSVYLPFFPSGGTLEAASTGAYEAQWTTIAQKCITNIPGTSDISIGTAHAFNADYTPWTAVGRPATFIAAWRRFVDRFRAVSPRFKFTLSATWGGSFDVATAYPGDTYVDEVGVGFFYDPTQGSVDPTTAWNNIRTIQYGLDYYRTRSWGATKRLVVVEWGAGGTDANAAAFIRLAADWFTAANVFRHSYFDEPGSTVSLVNTQNARPLAQAAFKEKFNAAVTTPTTPTTPTAPGTEPDPNVMLNVPYLTWDVGNRLLPFETMSGRQVDGLQARTDPAANEYTSVDWFLTTAVGGNGRPVYVVIPMVPDGSTLDAAASGAHDSAWTTIAQKVVADIPGTTSINVRTGWEHNVSWQTKWNSLGRAALFKTAYRRFVERFRAVSGGSRFKFVYNSYAGGSGSPADAYPGDDVVDEVGLTVRWETAALGTNGGAAFAALRDDVYGLNYVRNRTWGAAKRLVVDEWSMEGTDAEATVFLNLLADWMIANGVKRQGYSDIPNSASSLISASNQRPNTAAAYRARFGTVVVPDTSTPPTTTLPPVYAGNTTPGALLTAPYLGTEVATRLPLHESMLGKQVDAVYAWTANTAAEYTNVTWYATESVGGFGRKVHYLVPLVPEGSSLEAASTGSLDAQWTLIAQRIIAATAGTDSILIRTANEANGSWKPLWNFLGRIPTFKTAYRRFVERFRAVSGGSRFKFVYDANYGEGGDIGAAYPGDDVVDEIGIVAVWKAEFDGADPVAAFNKMKTVQYGFDYFRNRTWGTTKPLTFTAWGCSPTNGATDSGNATWITLMGDWMIANGIRRQTWWDNPGLQTELSTANNRPLARAAYKAKFGPAPTPPVDPENPVDPQQPGAVGTKVFISSAGKAVMVVSGSGVLLDAPPLRGATIPALVVNPAAPAFTPGTPGQVVASLSAKPTGVTRTLTPSDGRFTLSADGSQVLEGGSLTAPGTSASVTVTDTLSTASNSPQAVTFTIAARSGAINSAFSIPVTISGSGGQAGDVISFGQPFVKGHLAPGGVLTYERSNGARLATQYDNVSDLYDDGTIRYAVIHITDPGLSSTQVETGALIPAASPASTTPINLTSSLAGQPVLVEVKNGGSIFTFDVVSALGNARWLQGPLASQARVETDLPRAAVGNGTDARLVVDVTSTSDGVIDVDATVWNRNAFEPNQGTAIFDMRIIGHPGASGTLATKRSVSNIRTRLYCHYSMRARWKLADGTAARNRATVQHSVPYMMRTGWVANYDTGLEYSPTLVASMQAEMGSAGWNDPLSTRSLRASMASVDGDNSIGETTLAQAMWLATGDRVAAQYAMDQSDAAGGIPFHCFVRKYGRWANPIDMPVSRTRSQEGDFIASEAEGNPWVISTGHWADYNFVPYLLTGRRVCLDRLQAQASYGLMERAPASFQRGLPTGGLDDTMAGQAARKASIAVNAEGVYFTRGVEARSAAWVWRQLIDASIAPASQTPHGDLWRRVCDAVMNRWWSERTEQGQDQGSHFGLPKDWTNGDTGFGVPAQFDMQASQYVRGARLEMSNYLDWMQWADNWFSGRFTANNQGFNPADALQPVLKFGPTGDPPPYYGTWAGLQSNMGAATYGANFASLSSTIGGDQAQRAQAVNAQWIDAFLDLGRDATRTLAAKAFLDAIPGTKTNTAVSNYRLSPQTSIVRRGTTRGP